MYSTHPRVDSEVVVLEFASELGGQPPAKGASPLRPTPVAPRSHIRLPRRLEYRGYDSFGIAVRTNGGDVVTEGNALPRTDCTGRISEVIEPGTVCLSISESGETADVLSALDSRKSDDPTVALTNNPNSSLARRADALITGGAGPEIGVAATKTFVCRAPRRAESSASYVGTRCNCYMRSCIGELDHPRERASPPH